MHRAMAMLPYHLLRFAFVCCIGILGPSGLELLSGSACKLCWQANFCCIKPLEISPLTHRCINCPGCHSCGTGSSCGAPQTKLTPPLYLCHVALILPVISQQAPTVAATVTGSYGMYLARQGGLVTSSTNAASLAQYSDANSQQSAAAAPSPATVWPAPALGSSDAALSPEAGDNVISWELSCMKSQVMVLM